MNRRNYYFPYLIPFLLFAVCTYLLPLFNISPAIVYPLKTLVVAIPMVFYARVYADDIKPFFDPLAVFSGVIVFLLWVSLEEFYPQIGSSTGFNPFQYAEGGGAYALIAFRLIGAVIVVPVMEELFWRSFALRYLINPRFKYVPLGQFSWFSFIVVSIAFGFEHHRWLPGIIAGAVYAGLLYRSKNLFSPILAHAVTNLLLGIYVLMTKQWTYW